RDHELRAVPLRRGDLLGRRAAVAARHRVLALRTVEVIGGLERRAAHVTLDRERLGVLRDRHRSAAATSAGPTAATAARIRGVLFRVRCPFAREAGSLGREARGEEHNGYRY